MYPTVYVYYMYPTLPPEAVGATNVATFGIARNFDGVTNEGGFFCGWRWGYRGSRSVVLVPAFDVLEVMRAVKGEALYDLHEVKKFLHGISNAALTALSAKGRLYFAGTLGERDAVWVPFGYLVAERVSTDTDFIGIRVGYVLAGQAAVMQEFAKSLALCTGKPAPPVLLLAAAAAAAEAAAAAAAGCAEAAEPPASGAGPAVPAGADGEAGAGAG